MTYIWIPIRNKYYAVDNCENVNPTTLPSGAYEVGLILYAITAAMLVEILLVCVAMCSLFVVFLASTITKPPPHQFAQEFAVLHCV